MRSPALAVASTTAAMRAGGAYSLDPVDGSGQRSLGTKRGPSSLQMPVHVSALGLGGTGMPGAVQLNLSMEGVEAAVGSEQLARERAADGQARRVAHRGTWEPHVLGRSRFLIENYAPVERHDVAQLDVGQASIAASLVTPDPGVDRSADIPSSNGTGEVVPASVTEAPGVAALDGQALSSVDPAGVITSDLHAARPGDGRPMGLSLVLLACAAAIVVHGARGGLTRRATPARRRPTR